MTAPETRVHSGSTAADSSPSILRRTLFSPRTAPWIVTTALFVIHAAIRFGGLQDPSLIPISMMMIWPIPWILSAREGRSAIGLRRPDHLIWFVFGSLAAAVTLVLCALAAWAAFGTGGANWFVHHALMLRDILLEVPADMSIAVQYLIVTGPALIFSPLAEEFLFRGYLMESYSRRWGPRSGMIVQAGAFTLVHLAHYGLNPFNPMLLAVWLPSMFLAAVVLGWIVRRSGSLWPAIVAHAVFNAAMNAVVFWRLPGMLGL